MSSCIRAGVSKLVRPGALGYPGAMLLDKAWKPEAVWLLGVRICLTLLGGMMLLSAAKRWTDPLDRNQADFLAFVVGTLCFQGAALAWVHSFLREHATGWRDGFGLSLLVPRHWAKGAVLTLLGLLPTLALLGKGSEWVLRHLGVKVEMQAAVLMLQNHPSALHLLGFGIGAILLAPVAEEVLFRGIIYPVLKQTGFPALAWWGSSLIFAGIHLNLMAFIPMTVLALVLARLYERTGNLLAPILVHVLFNATNFTLALFIEAPPV